MDYLMLHGWGFRHTVWQRLEKSLKQSSIVFNPCLYRIAEETRDPSLRAIATCISAGLKRDCVLIAWSYGGLIAMLLARYSHHIKGIIFIASAPRFINTYNWTNTLDEKAYQIIYQRLLDRDNHLLAYFSGIVGSGDRAPRQTISFLRQHMASQQHREILLAWLDDLGCMDLREQLKTLTLPCCYLLGKEDALIHPSVALDMTSLNQQVLTYTLDACGHAPFISQLTQTKKIIEKFVDDHFSK